MENGHHAAAGKRKLDDDDNSTTSSKSSKVTSNGSTFNEPYQKGNMFKGLLRTMVDLGVQRPVCVLRKKLSGSDVSPDENRLLLPKKMMKEKLLELLTQEERARVDNEAGEEVAVIDRGCGRYSMTMKYLMNGKESYRTIGKGWSRFVAANRLEAGQTLDAWGFRLAGEGEGEERRGKGRFISCF
ncbi:putative B3 domain-containing protein At3g49610 [Typha latifolia]|uniref:putative B3 domain-containing protein At3g49610 n=1 Tax=Typha latifolia TaxID=4733 RepID=UPI003C2C2BD5